MSRAWKNVKKYERWVLIGIVILLLATFSVTGVGRAGCSGPASKDGDRGGSYEAATGKRESVSDTEYRAARVRYEPIYRFDGWGPSHRYMSELSGTPLAQRLPIDQATWIHLATVGAARAAGYMVGDEELRAAIEDYVLRAIARRPGVSPREQGARFTPELYDQVIERLYRLPKADFETTVREIVLKDKFLSDLVDTQRFTKDRKAAYEAWKPSRERVDLAFASVPAAQFADAVAKEEDTRSAVASQTELLGKVVTAALDVRRLGEVVKEWKAVNGALPVDAADFAAKAPGKRAFQGKDPWDAAYLYAKDGEVARFSSAGPDGKAGTADDVGTEVLDALGTLATLRRVADALVLWQGTTKAWPSALSDLTKAPTPAEAGKIAPPPPLPMVPKDAWEHDLAYDAAGPALLSMGPDGQRGTPDDLVAEVKPSSVLVPLPTRLAAYRLEALRDAWDHPLTVGLRSANPITFEAVSLGADGVPSADDVRDGNENDLQSFYNRVRLDFRLPLRRELEAVYVIPALVSDEAFTEAWKRFPEYRPDEKEAWDLFRQTGFYRTREGDGKDDKEIDPADPQKGYAAGLVAELREKGTLPKDAKTWPLPAPECFGDRKDAPAAGSPEAKGLPTADKDPLWKTYVERGWRRVVMKDQFFEKALNAMLKASRESSEAHAKWEKGGKTGPEPKVVTLREQLALWKDMQPGEADAAKGARFFQYYETKPGEPVSREDLEKHPDLGDYALSTALSPLKDDAYASIPTLLRDAALRAALHSVKVHEASEPKLAEVRAKVWPRYLETRAIEKAARVLEQVRADASKPVATAPGSDGKAPPAPAPEAKLAEVERLLKAAAEQQKFTYVLGRTGPFVGSAGAGRVSVPPAGAGEDEKLAWRRRAYVRKYGYDEVRALGSVQGVRSLEVGALGRRVLRDAEGGDAGTRSAYLVQVAWREDPSPEEFNGRQFLEWLTRNAYSEGEWTQSHFGPLHRPGYMYETLGRYYEDWDTLKRDFAINAPGGVDIPTEVPDSAP